MGLTVAEQEDNHFPHSAGHSSFVAAQDADGFSGCKHMLLACIQYFVHQDLEVSLVRAALNEFFSESVHLGLH